MCIFGPKKQKDHKVCKLLLNFGEIYVVYAGILAI